MSPFQNIIFLINIFKKGVYMAEKVGKYQLIDGKNKIPKALGEETEARAKEYAREAAKTDPEVQLLEITASQGAIVVNFRE